MLTTKQTRAVRNEYFHPDLLCFRRDGGQVSIARSYNRSTRPTAAYVGRQMQRELARAVSRIAPLAKVSLAQVAEQECFGRAYFTATFDFN